MNHLTTQSNAKLLQDQLTCPVTLEPLYDAVTLVPCAHKVNKIAAEKMYGILKDEWKIQIQEDKLCPVCKIPVVGYMKDHTTISIVKQLTELNEKELNSMLQKMKCYLAEKSKPVEKDVQMDLAYPGISAKFVHTDGDWKLYDSGGSLCRCMQFSSLTTNSLITQFSLLGYTDGDVTIRVTFSNLSNDLVEYLKKFNIVPNNSGPTHAHMSIDHDQLKLIFNILADNNEIPESHFEKIRDIVAKGKCERVSLFSPTVDSWLPHS